jgi:phosphatidate cytidylyltransferase
VNDKNRNLVARLVTAGVLLPLVVYLVWKGGYATGALISVAAVACAYEYFGIVLGHLTWREWVSVAMAGMLPFLPVLRPDAPGEACFWAVMSLSVFAWASSLFLGDLAKAPDRAAQLVMGTLYPAGGLTALCALRQRPDGMLWVIAALVITWANDTLAYFAGRLLGKHKLYPAVSPNKTWEGFAGGVVGSVGGLFITKAFFFPALSALDCVLLGLGGALLGPLGDLAESMLKRAHQTKDSSHLIPGHGGFLDRVDALLFNGPWVFVYVALIHRG